MRGKRGVIELGLGRGFVIEVIEAARCPAPGSPRVGSGHMAHARRDVADADADAPVIAPVRAGAVHGERVIE